MTDPASFARAQELVLPWPVQALHPNARVHWSMRAKHAKDARARAFILAREAFAGIQWPEGRLHVWIDGYAQDKRHRDHDGFLSSLKPSLDGIADAIGINDSRFVPHPWIKDEVRKPAEVRIRITGGPRE